MAKSDSPAVLVAGEITEGFRFIGPFKDYHEASEYAMRTGIAAHEGSWVTEIHPPKKPRPSGLKDEPSVLVVGNFSNGYMVVGPFDDFDQADNYTNSCNDLTWVVKLEKP